MAAVLTVLGLLLPASVTTGFAMLFGILFGVMQWSGGQTLSLEMGRLLQPLGHCAPFLAVLGGVLGAVSLARANDDRPLKTYYRVSSYISVGIGLLMLPWAVLPFLR